MTALGAFYLLNSLFAGSTHQALQLAGSAPATATTGTGWTVGTTAAPSYAQMAALAERAASVFGSAAVPGDGGPDLTLGDCYMYGPLTGMISGVWVLTVPVIAVTSGGDQDGRLRARLWVSDSVTGADAREVTLGPLVSNTISNLAVGVAQNCTIAFNPGRFGLQAEYFFLQLAWEVTGAGGAASRDVLVRVGTDAKVAVGLDLAAIPAGYTELKLLVDWDDDGDFNSTDFNGNGVSEDLSVDGLEGDCFSGRQSGRLSEQVAAGWCSLTVENLAGSQAGSVALALGKYSPFVRVVQYADLPATDRLVQIRGMVPVVDYLWTGVLNDVRPVTGRDGQPKVLIEALGPLSELAIPEVSLAPTRGEDLIAFGVHAGRVLDAAGWSATLRDLDDGDVYAGAWSPKKALAIDALRVLDDCELGLLRESKRGEIVFEARSRRLTRTESVAVQATFSDYGITGLVYDDLQPSSFGFMRGDQFDVVDFELPAFTVNTALGALWVARFADWETGGRTFHEDYLLPSAGSVTFTAIYGSSATQFVDAWQTPEIGVDILFEAPAVAGDLSISGVEPSANQLQFTITNSALFTIRLTRIQARGYRAEHTDPVGTTVGSGKRTWPRPGTLYRSLAEASTAGQLIVNRHRLNRPVLVMPMTSRASTAQLVECFRRQISDRVHVQAKYLKTRLGIEGMDCYVEGIGQSFRTSPETGLEMHTTYVLSAVEPLPEPGVPLSGGESPSLYALWDTALWDEGVWV